MRPVFQTRFGTDGNCWPACLASLFHVPLEEVDQCAAANPDWYLQTTKWLASRGLFQVEIFLKQNEPIPFTAPPHGTVTICGCFTERKLPHCIVTRINWTKTNENGQCGGIEFEILHDPMPGGSSEFIVDAIFLFCPISLTP